LWWAGFAVTASLGSVIAGVITQAVRDTWGRFGWRRVVKVMAVLLPAALLVPGSTASGSPGTDVVSTVVGVVVLVMVIGTPAVRFLPVRRGGLTGSGSAHSPPTVQPQAVGELRAQVKQRKTAIRAIPRDRWVAEQLPLRRTLERHLENIAGRMAATAPGSPDHERLRTLAAQQLAELDKHISAAQAGGRNARWRGGISRLHRWLYVPTTVIGIGLLLHGMYTISVLAGAPPIAALIATGVLFTVASFGQALGMALIGPWWHRLSVRVMTVATLLGVVGALLAFAVIDAWAPGYYLAAVMAGAAASGNFNLLDALQNWIGRTTQLRRDSGQRAVLGDGVVGLSVLGLVTTLSLMLGLTEALLKHSLTLAVGVAVAITAVIAAASWLVAPSERWDRPSPPTLTQMFVAPFLTMVRNKYARAVVAVYGTYAFTLASIDAVWRAFFKASLAPEGLVLFAGLAFIGGGGLFAVIFVRADRSAAKSGATTGGLLSSKPGAFVVGNALLMAVGAAIVGFTQHVFGDPLIGATVGLYLLETTSTGKLLGLSAVIKKTTRLTEEEKIATKTAGGLIKAIFYVVGSLVSSQVAWASGGWDWVSALLVGASLVLFTFAAQIDPRAASDLVKGLGRITGVLAIARMIQAAVRAIGGGTWWRSRAGLVRLAVLLAVGAALLVLLAGSAAADTMGTWTRSAAARASLLALVGAGVVAGVLVWLVRVLPIRGPPAWLLKAAVVAVAVTVLMLLFAVPAVAESGAFEWLAGPFLTVAGPSVLAVGLAGVGYAVLRSPGVRAALTKLVGSALVVLAPRRAERTRILAQARELAREALWLQARDNAAGEETGAAEAVFARLAELVDSVDGSLYPAHSLRGADAARRDAAARAAGERLLWRREAWARRFFARTDAERDRLSSRLESTAGLSPGEAIALGLWLREGPERLFDLPGWDELSADVQRGFSAVYRILVDSGVAAAVANHAGPVEVQILPDHEFEQVFRKIAEGKVTGMPYAFSRGMLVLGGGTIYFRTSTFSGLVDGAGRPLRDTMQIVGWLAHELVHTMGSLFLEQGERNAFWLQHRIEQAQRERARLADLLSEPGATEADLARQRKLVVFWDGFLREWRAGERAPRNYPLDPFYGHLERTPDDTEGFGEYRPEERGARRSGPTGRWRRAVAGLLVAGILLVAGVVWWAAPGGSDVLPIVPATTSTSGAAPTTTVTEPTPEAQAANERERLAQQTVMTRGAGAQLQAKVNLQLRMNEDLQRRMRPFGERGERNIPEGRQVTDELYELYESANNVDRDLEKVLYRLDGLHWRIGEPDQPLPQLAVELDSIGRDLSVLQSMIDQLDQDLVELADQVERIELEAPTAFALYLRRILSPLVLIAAGIELSILGYLLPRLARRAGNHFGSHTSRLKPLFRLTEPELGGVRAVVSELRELVANAALDNGTRARIDRELRRVRHRAYAVIANRGYDHIPSGGTQLAGAPGRPDLRFAVQDVARLSEILETYAAAAHTELAGSSPALAAWMSIASALVDRVEQIDGPAAASLLSDELRAAFIKKLPAPLRERMDDERRIPGLAGPPVAEAAPIVIDEQGRQVGDAAATSEEARKSRPGLLRRLIGRLLGLIVGITMLVLVLPTILSAPHAAAEPASGPPATGPGRPTSGPNVLRGLLSAARWLWTSRVGRLVLSGAAIVVTAGVLWLLGAGVAGAVPSDSGPAPRASADGSDAAAIASLLPLTAAAVLAGVVVVVALPLLRTYGANWVAKLAPPGRWRLVERVRAAPAFAPLTYRNYRLYLVGGSFWSFSSMTHYVVLGWLPLTLAGPSELGQVMMLQTLPAVVLALVGGQLADRFGKRWLLVAGLVGMMASASVLALLNRSGTLTLGSVFWYSAVTGALIALSTPIFQAFRKDLVPSDHLNSAMALDSIVFRSATILGGLVGGWLVASSVTRAVVVLVVTTAVMVMALLLMKPKQFIPTERTRRAFREGLRFVRKSAGVKALLRLSTLVTLFGLTLGTTLPVLARVLGAPTAVGVLMAASDAGAWLGTVLAAKYRGTPRFAAVAFAALAFLAAQVVAAGAAWLVPNVLVAAGALLFAGVPMALFFALRGRLLQQMPGVRSQGMVLGLHMALVSAAMAVGARVVGEAAERIDVRLLMGALPALAAIAVVAMSRRPADDSGSAVSAAGTQQRPATTGVLRDAARWLWTSRVGRWVLVGTAAVGTAAVLWLLLAGTAGAAVDSVVPPHVLARAEEEDASHFGVPPLWTAVLAGVAIVAVAWFAVPAVRNQLRRSRGQVSDRARTSPPISSATGTAGTAEASSAAARRGVGRLVRGLMWIAVTALFMLVPVALVLLFQGRASNAAFALRGALNLLPSRNGVLRVVQAIPLLMTFLINLVWLVPAVVTGSGLSAWISAFYVATIAMFGMNALSATHTAVHNREGPVHRIAGWLVTWVAFPIASNVGNVLLAINLGWVAFDAVLLVATVVLLVAFAYSSFLGMVEAVRPGRFGEPYLRVMGAAGNVSLLYWGLLALWPAHWFELVAVGIAVVGVIAVARGVSKLAAWRARLIHSPPSVGSTIRAFATSFLTGWAPGLALAWSGAGLLLALPLDLPTTVTAVSALATAHVLWLLQRLAAPAGRRGESGVDRTLRVVVLGGAAGAASAALAIVLGGSAALVVTAAVGAAASPVMAAAFRSLRDRSPPWVRILIESAAAAVVVAWLLATAVARSAARFVQGWNADPVARRTNVRRAAIVFSLVVLAPVVFTVLAGAAGVVLGSSPGALHPILVPVVLTVVGAMTAGRALQRWAPSSPVGKALSISVRAVVWAVGLVGVVGTLMVLGPLPVAVAEGAANTVRPDATTGMGFAAVAAVVVGAAVVLGPTRAKQASDSGRGHGDARGSSAGGGPSRRGGGDLTAEHRRRLSELLHHMYESGARTYVPVVVLDQEGRIVGELWFYLIEGFDAWVATELGIDDLDVFGWAAHPARTGVVAIDARRFNSTIGKLMALARAPGGDRVSELLNGYLRSLHEHETVHFDNPGASHRDAVFDGHREVRHDLLDEAMLRDLLRRFGTSEEEIGSLTGADVLWPGFLEALERYTAQVESPGMTPGELDRLELARIRILFDAARVRRADPAPRSAAGSSSQARAPPVAFDVLLAVVVRHGTVALHRLAAELKQNPSEVAAKLDVLIELELVRAARRPEPVVYQATELGAAVSEADAPIEWPYQLGDTWGEIGERIRAWPGFREVAQRHEEQTVSPERTRGDLDLVEAAARIRFELDAARVRRTDPAPRSAVRSGSQVRGPAVTLDALLVAVAGHHAVALHRLAVELNQNPRQLEEQLERLAEANLVRVARTPKPLVYQVTDRGAEVLEAGESIELLRQFGTSWHEIEDLIERKVLWTGFQRALERYRAQAGSQGTSRAGPDLVDAAARIQFALDAARVRRDDPPQGRAAGSRPAARAPVILAVLLAAVAARHAVALHRLAADLNQNPRQLATQLDLLAELSLVRVARTPKPLVYQVSELGVAVLGAGVPIGLLGEPKLHPRHQEVLRRQLAAFELRVGPERNGGPRGRGRMGLHPATVLAGLAVSVPVFVSETGIEVHVALDGLGAAAAPAIVFVALVLGGLIAVAAPLIVLVTMKRTRTLLAAVALTGAVTAAMAFTGLSGRAEAVPSGPARAATGAVAAPTREDDSSVPEFAVGALAVVVAVVIGMALWKRWQHRQSASQNDDHPAAGLVEPGRGHGLVVRRRLAPAGQERLAEHGDNAIMADPGTGKPGPPLLRRSVPLPLSYNKFPQDERAEPFSAEELEAHRVYVAADGKYYWARRDDEPVDTETIGMPQPDGLSVAWLGIDSHGNQYVLDFNKGEHQHVRFFGTHGGLFAALMMATVPGDPGRLALMAAMSGAFDNDLERLQALLEELGVDLSRVMYSYGGHDKYVRRPNGPTPDVLDVLSPEPSEPGAAGPAMVTAPARLHRDVLLEVIEPHTDDVGAPLDEEELEPHRAFVAADGRLYWAHNGVAVKTSEIRGNFGDLHFATYGIDAHGNLHIGVSAHADYGPAIAGYLATDPDTPGRPVHLDLASSAHRGADPDQLRTWAAETGLDTSNLRSGSLRDIRGDQGSAASSGGVGLLGVGTSVTDGSADTGVPWVLPDAASSYASADGAGELVAVTPLSSAVDLPVLVIGLVAVGITAVVLVRLRAAFRTAIARLGAWLGRQITRHVRATGRLVLGVGIGFVTSELVDSTAVGVAVLIGGSVLAVWNWLVVGGSASWGGKAWSERGPPVGLIGLGIAIGAFWWLQCPECGNAATSMAAAVGVPFGRRADHGDRAGDDQRELLDPTDPHRGDDATGERALLNGWQLRARTPLVIAILAGILLVVAVLVAVVVLGADSWSAGVRPATTQVVDGPGPVFAIGLLWGFGRFPVAWREALATAGEKAREEQSKAAQDFTANAQGTLGSPGPRDGALVPTLLEPVEEIGLRAVSREPAPREGRTADGVNGSVVVVLPSGRITRPDDREYEAAAVAAHELYGEQNPSPLSPNDPVYQLVSPDRTDRLVFVLAELDHRYRVREWRLGLRRTALIRFEGEVDGRQAVFVDRDALELLRGAPAVAQRVMAPGPLRGVTAPELVAALETGVVTRGQLTERALAAPAGGTDAVLRHQAEIAILLVELLEGEPGQSMSRTELTELLGSELAQTVVALHPRLVRGRDDGAVLVVPIEPTGAVPSLPHSSPERPRSVAPAAVERRPITADTPAGRMIFAAVTEFVQISAALPGGPRTREAFSTLLDRVRQTIVWALEGEGTAVTHPNALTSSDAEIRMRVAEPTIESYRKLLREALERIGVPLDADGALGLAVRLVIWHELAHVLARAYTVGTGNDLDGDSYAAGLSTSLAIPLERSASPELIEQERYATGLSHALLTSYITERYGLTALQAHYLPAVLRAAQFDARHSRSPLGWPTPRSPLRPGYVYYDSHHVALAKLQLAALRDAGHSIPDARAAAAFGRRLASVRPDIELLDRAQAIADDAVEEPTFWADAAVVLERLATAPVAHGELVRTHLGVLVAVLERTAFHTVGPAARLLLGATGPLVLPHSWIPDLAGLAPRELIIVLRLLTDAGLADARSSLRMLFAAHRSATPRARAEFLAAWIELIPTLVAGEPRTEEIRALAGALRKLPAGEHAGLLQEFTSQLPEGDPAEDTRSVSARERERGPETQVPPMQNPPNGGREQHSSPTGSLAADARARTTARTRQGPRGPPQGGAAADAALVTAEDHHDLELAQAVRTDPDGASAAIGRLYERHHAAAMTQARRLTVSEDDAEDLVSEGFLRVIRALRRGRGPDHAFRGYLLTAIRHLAFERLRRRAREPTTRSLGDREDFPESEPPAPVHLLELHRLLNALPDRWQIALRLSYEQDLHPADIAKLMNLSPNGVSQLLVRAREGLRRAVLQQLLPPLPADADALCVTCTELLPSYVRGGGRTRPRVAAHLNSCAACARLAEYLAELDGRLHDLVALQHPSPSAGSGPRSLITPRPDGTSDGEEPRP
jgi:RNA polymerase sigma factor (sigma-70 family)